MKQNYWFQDEMFRELIIDNFAGGGGASTGMELALGMPVDIAINHDAMAIKMHEKNHPFTQHIQNDVFAVDPLEVTGGRPVGLAWFSPDCTHFSKAKGGKPRKKEIRDLAWVVVKWAKAVKPRVIMLENVEEFKTWGPLDDDGYPIKEQTGEEFRRWWNALEAEGYEIESKELVAADYGTPTIRKRLFIVARCDGKPIVWPKPTHSKEGKNGLKKWVGANTIIDFSVRGKSIYNRKNKKGEPKDLADNTMRRIARGLDKFVIKNPEPFIVDESQIAPYIMVNNTNHPGTNIKNPKSTTTTANKDILMNPVIVPIGYGEAPGQKPRVQNSEKPLNTIVSHSTKHHTVAYIGREFTDAQGSNIKNPLPTITAVDHNRLVAIYLQEYFGNAQHGQDINKPLHTITSRERQSVITVKLDPINDSELGNWPLVRDMLNKHAGYDLAEDEIILFNINGIWYFITDIEMRMLLPKELYLAQGFPADYNFTCDGEMTRTEQVRKVGNSVCPSLPYALVKANYEPSRDVPPLTSMLMFNHYVSYGNLKRFRSKEHF